MAGLASTAVLLSGCGLSFGSGDDDKVKAPQGVVTETQAEKIVDRYVSVAKEADAKRDGKLLATVEGGGQLERGRAQYAHHPHMTAAERKESAAPDDYVDREFLIPRKGRATWFAVTARPKGGPADGERQLLVFDREKGSRSWHNMASVTATPAGDDKKEGPLRFAEDKHGFARAVPSDSSRHRVKSPDELPGVLADLYTLRSPLESSAFADTKTARSVHDAAQGVEEKLGQHASATFSQGKNKDSATDKVYALETRDRGTFVVFNTAIDQHQQVASAGMTMTPDREMYPFVGKKAAKGFTIHRLHQFSALVPARGKIELLGYQVTVTDATRK
ncbi:hypothetical protein DEH18_29325 [Streptomyces sp. NHF165]|uniref:hypothetical protein n=1 Tax=Streptomyces sp. NHF165 TaxID=2175864 RepID=UPI00132F2D35|nr:hypothetical protein [Streptomyces sp. NHF165]QHF97257.1 hypothetical protein DEH18_29325 [Streptomyces sp. NHF165]